MGPLLILKLELFYFERQAIISGSMLYIVSLPPLAKVLVDEA